MNSGRPYFGLPEFFFRPQALCRVCVPDENRDTNRLTEDVLLAGMFSGQGAGFRGSGVVLRFYFPEKFREERL